VRHSSSEKSLLINARAGGIYQLTSRINCDGVIRKGCPDFFCTGLAKGVPSLARGCPARGVGLRSRAIPAMDIAFRMIAEPVARRVEQRVFAFLAFDCVRLAPALVWRLLS